MSAALTHSQLDSWWVAIGIGFLLVVLLALLGSALSRYLARVEGTVSHVSDAARELEDDIAVSMPDQAVESRRAVARRPPGQ